MRDNKAFASLTSGLLARKGQAKPAMRPQGFGQGMGYPDDLGWNDMGHNDAAYEAARGSGPRLPANLSGPSSAGPVLAELPLVVRQQDEIAREFAAPVIEAAIEPELPVAKPKPVVADVSPPPAAQPAKAVRAGRRGRPAAKDSLAALPKRDGGRKAAFTLRLDADRHLHLRLACAVQNRSAQQLVTEALDRLLGSLPDVARLAASLPQQGG